MKVCIAPLKLTDYTHANNLAPGLHLDAHSNAIEFRGAAHGQNVHPAIRLHQRDAININRPLAANPDVNGGYKTYNWAAEWWPTRGATLEQRGNVGEDEERADGGLND